MMSSLRKTSVDPWVRVYDVKDAGRHRKGYTVYKVVSKVFPRNSVEATTEVVVWKRFSDFKKLYKVLSGLHQALHLKGKFPEFVKGRFFGRFDEDVVAERRQCALALLQFVAQYPALYNSQFFVKFFDGGQEISFSEDENGTLDFEVSLEPCLTATSAALISDSDDSSRHSDNLRVPDNSLQGTWQHRCSAENISLSSDCSDATLAPSESGDPPNGNTGSIHPSDLSLFDPLHLCEPTAPLPSSDWLLSALQSDVPIRGLKESTSSPSGSAMDDLLLFPMPFADEDIEDLPPSKSSPSPVPLKIEFPSTESFAVASNQTLSRLHPTTENVPSGQSSPSKNLKRSTLFGSNVSISQLFNKSPLHTCSKIEAPHPSYLFEAAKLISRGKCQESDYHYSDAFNTYKDVVSVLLGGVQGETDPSKRDSVRRKIAQYLSHAEDLYRRHLESDSKDNLRWAIEGRSSPRPSSRVQPIVGHLRGDLCDLVSLKVLGIVGNVLLVLDTACNQTRVIKSFQKSGSGSSHFPNILPQFLPHLVHLHRIYETEHSFYLLLEYGSGGRLWDYVSAYLARSPVSPCAEGNLPDRGLSDSPNVYSGHHSEISPNHMQPPLTGEQSAVAENGGKSSGEDSDLAAPANPSASYVALLTKYASSVTASKRLSLAHCTIPANEERYSEESDDDVLYSPLSTPDVEFAPDIPAMDCLPKGRQEEIGQPGSDVEDLISYSKALLQTVDRTLKIEEISPPTVLSASEVAQQDIVVRKTKKETQTELAPKHRRRKTSKNAGKHHQAQPSLGRSHQWERCPRLSSSLGSLEKFQRVRHLSEVFRDLESQRRASSAFHLPESCVRVWAAEMVWAMAQLHTLGIVWQDFHPNNILLGERGHILLSYVCRINCVDRILSLDAKRNMYSAPEVGGIFPVTPACDWWSLGAVLYELFTGMSLVSSHSTGITSHTHLHLPAHLSLEARDFLDKLLKFHPSERLGAGTDGIESIQSHPFFAGIDWTQISAR